MAKKDTTTASAKGAETIDALTSLGGDRPSGDSQKKDNGVRVVSPEPLIGWNQLTGIHAEVTRTENSTRRLISLAIVLVFVVWALVGGFYLMFFAGNIQVLLDGSAFISGPLGVVIGYYFGVGDDPKKG